MSNISVPSLESLRTRFRTSGADALNTDELSRLLNHARELGLAEGEANSLRVARQLDGKQPLAE